MSCSSSSRSAGEGRRALPEKISSEVTIGDRKFIIDGAEVTTPSGRKAVLTGDIQEIKSKSELQKAKKAGITDPVQVGRAVVERKVAERAVEQREKERENYNKNMQNNVKGLDELRSAIDNNRREYEKQKRSIERGEILYKAKNIDVSSLKTKFPRAAAYLEAEKFYNASHYRKSALGREAMDKIRQGKSYKSAIAEMEREWKKYTRSKAFD